MAITRGVTRLWRLYSRSGIENGANVLVLEGRLGQATAGELRAAADAVLATDPRDLVIDLSGVDYLSSAAIKEFERISTEQSERGRVFTLRSPSPAARLSLELAGLSGCTK
jgi:anti-sigma B factor antagonist